MRKISVLFLCLRFIFSGHSVYLHAAYQENSELLNVKTHLSQPWIVHEITKDFELLDVWEYPILADKTKNQDFTLFLKVMRQPPKVNVNRFFSLRALISGSLVALRWVLGEIFSLDKQINTLPIPGCKETSVKDRLSVEDQKRNLTQSAVEDGNNKFAWRTVYLYENEMLIELSNETAHALMHFGWIHKAGNFYTAQLAVYSKPRGDLGAFYMKLIMPFRRFFVYPALMDEVKARWEVHVKSSQE